MNTRILLGELQATVLQTLSDGPPPMDFHSDTGIPKTPISHVTPAFLMEMRGFNI